MKHPPQYLLLACCPVVSFHASQHLPRMGPQLVLFFFVPIPPLCSHSPPTLFYPEALQYHPYHFLCTFSIRPPSLLQAEKGPIAQAVLAELAQVWSPPSHSCRWSCCAGGSGQGCISEGCFGVRKGQDKARQRACLAPMATSCGALRTCCCSSVLVSGTCRRGLTPCG